MWINFAVSRIKAENCARIPRPRPRVVQPAMTNKKDLLLVAFILCGRFSAQALSPGATVNVECMIQFIGDKWRSTGDKWRRLHSNPIHLSNMWWQMDYARPHWARAVQDYFEQRNIKTVWQSPYSSHLNFLIDFCLSGSKMTFTWWISQPIRK